MLRICRHAAAVLLQILHQPPTPLLVFSYASSIDPVRLSSSPWCHQIGLGFWKQPTKRGSDAKQVVSSHAMEFPILSDKHTPMPENLKPFSGLICKNDDSDSSLKRKVADFVLGARASFANAFPTWPGWGVRGFCCSLSRYWDVVSDSCASCAKNNRRMRHFCCSWCASQKWGLVLLLKRRTTRLDGIYGAKLPTFPSSVRTVHALLPIDMPCRGSNSGILWKSPLREDSICQKSLGSTKIHVAFSLLGPSDIEG